MITQENLINELTIILSSAGQMVEETKEDYNLNDLLQEIREAINRIMYPDLPPIIT